MNVTFSGSRHWLDTDIPRVVATIQAGIKQLKQKHGESLVIHVGDAFGVDQMVVMRSIAAGVPVVVYGCNDHYRNIDLADLSAEGRALVSLVSVSVRGSRYMYFERNKHLVAAGDRVYGLHNGQSNGTIHTLNVAVECHKPAFIWTIAGGWSAYHKRTGNQ